MSGEAATHRFDAFAFAENFPLKDLAARLPEARIETGVLRLSLPEGGEMYAFGPDGKIYALPLIGMEPKVAKVLADSWSELEKKIVKK